MHQRNNGNLTGQVNYYAYGYSYDDEDRLVSVIFSGISKSDFKYDGLGRLRQRQEYTWSGGWYLSSEVNYVYDGRRVIQERDGNNTPTVSYTRGSDLAGSLEGAGGIGGLLARTHGYSGGSWSTHNYCHADGGGNITYIMNSNQTVAACATTIILRYQRQLKTTVSPVWYVTLFLSFCWILTFYARPCGVAESWAPPGAQDAAEPQGLAGLRVSRRPFPWPDPAGSHHRTPR